MINSENTAQISRTNPVWTKGRIRWLWQTVPVALFLAGVIIVFSYHDAQQKSLLSQYRASPNCITGASTLKTLPPCTRVPMQVTDKRSEHNSKGPDSYYLTLRTASGKTEEVPLLGHNLWDRALIGGTVTAKSWRGKIVIVTGYGYSPMTWAYPRADSSSSGYCITMCTIALLLMPFVILKGWREQGVVNDATDSPSKVE